MDVFIWRGNSLFFRSTYSSIATWDSHWFQGYCALLDVNAAVDMKATAIVIVCDAIMQKAWDATTWYRNSRASKRNSASSTPVVHFTCIVCLVNLGVAVEARGRILVDGEPIGWAQSRDSGIKSLRVFIDCCFESSPTLASQWRTHPQATPGFRTHSPVESWNSSWSPPQEYSTRRRTVDHLINNWSFQEIPPPTDSLSKMLMYGVDACLNYPKETCIRATFKRLRRSADE